MTHQLSLKEALIPLKESSKSAIADANCEAFDETKKFLHLERNIESQLRTFLEAVQESDSNKLFLVCGNVGDGKSHLLASIGINHPELLEGVELHNDATESSEPSATFIDELNKIFTPFSDQNIDTGNTKTVIAINLGTLNNFLASDEKGNFSQLAKFVKRKKILEVSDIVECEFEDDSPFLFVNFCDHNLFHLTKNGPESTLIETAIQRVVSPDGPFFEAYKNQKERFPDNCPMCFNFVTLQSQQMRKNISSLLVECIIKGEIIISIRALYNFIYELIVPIELEPLDTQSTITTINMFTQEDFLRNIFPNYIFSHPELSYIFRELQRHDPATRRGETMDEAIVELMVSDSPLNVISKFIPLDDINVNLANIFRNNSSTDEYINTFIRTAFFWPNPDAILLNNLTYKAYMKLMFDWYSGNGKSLKPLYKLVQNAVTSWRGQAGPGRINIDIGRQQLEYRASESIKFKPTPVEITPKNEEKIHIFNAFLPLSYKLGDCPITLSITYNLYSLVKAINEGYRPTSLDHSNFVVFNEFVQQMETSSETQKQVFFTDSANKQQFILELDDFGDFCFSEVTQ